ncbi:MAG TPA: GGDEF domain-containing protein [Candidatus Baltobacteraceae bacterium]|nr:GGDEF domain-containing protein [Candidatus Baltobacteraceae bacterium]
MISLATDPLTLARLETLAEALLALAQFWIPILLLIVIRNRPEPGARWILSLFSIMILLDGATHEVNLLAKTDADAILGVTLRIVQGMVAVITVLVLVPFIPHLIRMSTSATDALTGLPNRDRFSLRMKQALGRIGWRGNYRFAVLFVDLDGFKSVNDRFGHTVGDKLLIEVSRRLSACVRARDVVARYGGDEFTVLLDGVGDRHVAEYAAERITYELSQPYDVEGTAVHVGASIGIVMPDRKTDPSSIIQEADRAMYTAKALKR